MIPFSFLTNPPFIYLQDLRDLKPPPPPHTWLWVDDLHLRTHPHRNPGPQTGSTNVQTRYHVALQKPTEDFTTIQINVVFLYPVDMSLFKDKKHWDIEILGWKTLKVNLNGPLQTNGEKVNTIDHRRRSSYDPHYPYFFKFFKHLFLSLTLEIFNPSLRKNVKTTTWGSWVGTFGLNKPLRSEIV